MRLFHVSEEDDIKVFIPRIPSRKLDQDKRLVWAVCERALPNYLVPRDCPRVTYHINKNTSKEDMERFFTSNIHKHAVIIENRWYETIANATIYIYEFNTKNFYLHDEIAGYYVSEQNEIPINKIKVTNLFEELFKRNVEVRILNDLHSVAQRVQNSSLNWSFCRMRNSKRMENIL